MIAVNTEKEQLELIKKVLENNSEKESELVSKAISKLKELNNRIFHSDEKVKENLDTAIILADLNASPTTITAALLCSKRLEPTEIAEIQNEFGKEVSFLIQEKTGFEKTLKFEKKIEGTTAELKKLVFFSLTKNIKLILLVLADRLSLLRKIHTLPEEDKQALIEEQKDILIPLAHKLGAINIKSEAEDLVFKCTDTKKYIEILAESQKEIRNKQKEIENISQTLNKKAKEKNLEIKISGRTKSIYSTYKKMLSKNKAITGIYDIIALRVICNDVKDCYEMLGIVHSLWKPLSEEFDDYITKPKENNYRSLHTTVLGPNNKYIEIQIRTHEMHREAEFGVASHWKYKKHAEQKLFDKKILWLNELLAWQKDLKQAPTRIAKVDFFGDNIYVLSPKGDTLELPNGSTALDFAYAIHEDIGNKCKSAKVNQKIVPLNHKLETADLIEITTAFNQKPKIQWLNFVATEKAKKKIQQALELHKLNPVKKYFPDKHSIKTTDNRIKIAKCCLPIPGDRIIGFRTTKRKIVVHRDDCKEILKFSDKSQTTVSWDLNKKLDYFVGLEIAADDRAGLLSDILNVFTAHNISILDAKAKLAKGETTTCSFKIETKNLQELEKTIEKIQAINSVRNVKRV